MLEKIVSNFLSGLNLVIKYLSFFCYYLNVLSPAFIVMLIFDFTFSSYSGSDISIRKHFSSEHLSLI